MFDLSNFVRLFYRQSFALYSIYTCMYIMYDTYMYVYTVIKTHGSESRGKEEAGLHDEPVSHL